MWEHDRFFVMMDPRCIDTGEQTCGDIAHVSFDACDLAREEQILALDVLKRGTKEFR